MKDSDDLLASLRAELDRYDEYLARVSEVSELAASVQKRKEEVEARIEALERLPDDVLDEVAPAMKEQQEREFEKIDAALPRLPVIEYRTFVATLSSSGTSSDSSVIASIARVDPNQASWYPAFLEPYKTLSEDRSRETHIIEAYSELNPELGGYIDKALSTVRSAIGGVASVDLASQHLRTAIQKIWGELTAKAREECSSIGSKRFELKKVNHRSLIAECLGAEFDTQEKVSELLESLSTLYGDLSGPAKNPFGDDLRYLDDVATRWRLHLFNLARSLGL